MIFKVDNDVFVKEYNVLLEDKRTYLINKIDYLIERGFVCEEGSVPPIQTPPSLHAELKNDAVFVSLLTKISNLIGTYYDSPLILAQSWANISTETNCYAFHKHTSDLSCVYYLKNTHPFHGTYIDNRVVIPGDENSILLFDGKILHSIVNMPPEIGVKDYRYSIAFDFYKEDNYLKRYGN